VNWSHLSKMKCLTALLLTGIVFSSCTLPKDLSGTDKINAPSKFETIPDSSQTITQVPKWQNFFQDSMLVTLIDTAIKNNIDLKIAIQRIYQAEAHLNYSRKAFYPDLSARGSIGTTQYGKYTENGVGNFDTNKSSNITQDQIIPTPVPDGFVGLQTNWETGFAGKLRNRKKGAYYNYLSSAQGKRFVQTQLVSNVARLYYELLAADNELKIIRKNLNLQERAMEIVDIQKNSGQINELAVKQFHVQLLQSKSLEADKIQQIISIENSLNALLGRYPQPINRTDTLLTNKQVALLKTSLPAQLILNRPDIREAELLLNANEAQLKSVRAAFFPSLNLSAYMALNGFNATYFFNSASAAYHITGALTAPLLNRKEITREYWLQASRKKEAFLQYQKIVFIGVGEVSTYYNRTLAFQRMSDFKQQEVSELKLAIGIANDLFLTGFASYLEVVTVRRNVLESEIQLTEVRKGFFDATIDLYKALGGGWE